MTKKPAYMLIELPKVTRKGLTLIELLIVVAIISLMMAILLPAMGRAKELVRRATCGLPPVRLGSRVAQLHVRNSFSWVNTGARFY